MATLEQTKQKFLSAVQLKGRTVTIRHENYGNGVDDGYDPVLGSYNDARESPTYTVDVVPMSPLGAKQFAERMMSRFLIDPQYEAYSFGVGDYTPLVGDVINFDGRVATVTAVDVTSIDGTPVHYQVGLKYSGS